MSKVSRTPRKVVLFYARLRNVSLSEGKLGKFSIY
jgi:hypothetical protein